MIKFELDTTLTIQIYWSVKLRDATVFEKLWTRVRTMPVPATWFGTHEPFKQRVEPDIQEPFRLINFQRTLLFGDKKRVSGELSRHTDGLSEASVFVKLPAWDPAWADWICGVCEDVPILFGRACSYAEQQRKHAVVTEYIQGRRHSAIGSTRPELFEYLPGVYWLTLLGPELTGALDVTRAAQVPAATVRELGGSQRAIFASASPFDDLAVRAAREREIAVALGDDYFFDRERMSRMLQPVPAFAAALATMKQHAYD